MAMDGILTTQMNIIAVVLIQIVQVTDVPYKDSAKYVMELVIMNRRKRNDTRTIYR